MRPRGPSLLWIVLSDRAARAPADNVCIDSMSVHINKRMLERCSNNISAMEKRIAK